MPFCFINQNVYPSKEELCIFWNSALSKAHFSVPKYSTIFILCFIIRDIVQFHLFSLRINKNNSNRQCILKNLHHRLKCMFLEDFSNNNILMNKRYTKKKVKYKTSLIQSIRHVLDSAIRQHETQIWKVLASVADILHNGANLQTLNRGTIMLLPPVDEGQNMTHFTLSRARPSIAPRVLFSSL